MLEPMEAMDGVSIKEDVRKGFLAGLRSIVSSKKTHQYAKGGKKEEKAGVPRWGARRLKPGAVKNEVLYGKKQGILDKLDKAVLRKVQARIRHVAIPDEREKKLDTRFLEAVDPHRCGYLSYNDLKNALRQVCKLAHSDASNSDLNVLFHAFDPYYTREVHLGEFWRFALGEEVTPPVGFYSFPAS